MGLGFVCVEGWVGVGVEGGGLWLSVQVLVLINV